MLCLSSLLTSAISRLMILLFYTFIHCRSFDKTNYNIVTIISFYALDVLGVSTREAPSCVVSCLRQKICSSCIGFNCLSPFICIN